MNIRITFSIVARLRFSRGQRWLTSLERATVSCFDDVTSDDVVDRLALKGVPRRRLDPCLPQLYHHTWLLWSVQPSAGLRSHVIGSA